MSHTIVPPVSPVLRWPNGRKAPTPTVPEKASSKISSFVLEKMEDGELNRIAALLPAYISPKVVLQEMKGELREEKELPLHQDSPHQRFAPLRPLGLKGNSSSWLNATLQLLCHLPKISELVAVASRRFDPIRGFMDRYAAEQMAGRNLFSLRASILQEFMMQFLPKEGVDFLKIFALFFGLLRSEIPHLPEALLFVDSIVFHPERMLFAGDGAIEHLMQTQVFEFFLGRACWQNAPSVLKRQFFPRTQSNFYDLDAFVEGRCDGTGRCHYVAHLNVRGTWYQCDDESVRVTSSSALSVPLSRGVLFHYQRKTLF